MTTANATQPILQRALAAVPEYVARSAARRDLRQRRRDAAGRAVQTESAVTNDLLSEVEAIVLAGGDVPTDIGARILGGREAAEHAKLEEMFVRQLMVRMENTEAQAVMGAKSDPAFRVLSVDLAAVIEDVGRLDKTLGSIDTPEQALRDGPEAAAAWAELDAAVRRYDEIREAQARIHRMATGDDGSMRLRHEQQRESAGYVANLTDFDPRMIAVRARNEALRNPQDHSGQAPTIDRFVPRGDPWPAAKPTAGSGHWPTTECAAYIRWLATSAAEPWVPTLRELEAKLAEIEAWMKPAKQRTADEGRAAKAEADKQFRRMTRELDRQRGFAAEEQRRLNDVAANERARAL